MTLVEKLCDVWLCPSSYLHMGDDTIVEMEENFLQALESPFNACGGLSREEETEEQTKSEMTALTLEKINERRRREIESEREIESIEREIEPQQGAIGKRNKMQKLREKISGVEERIWRTKMRQRETAKQDAESLEDANSWVTNKTEVGKRKKRVTFNEQKKVQEQNKAEIQEVIDARDDLDTIHQGECNTSKEMDQSRRQREDKNGQIEEGTSADPTLGEIERIIDLWVENSCQHRGDERTTALRKRIVVSDTSVKSRTKGKRLPRLRLRKTRAPRAML
mmetsp:Transcript_15168/g.32682  ORF Transcript_15168/g.32682 Transcript_15168/m.32682 type:complete len:280 (-) Transcript_15168:47-886(-)